MSVKGYRELSSKDIALINEWRAVEHEVLRWLAIARTRVQEGVMAAHFVRGLAADTWTCDCGATVTGKEVAEARTFDAIVQMCRRAGCRWPDGYRDYQPGDVVTDSVAGIPVMHKLSNGLPPHLPSLQVWPLRAVVSEIVTWQNHNFPGWADKPYWLLLGAVEELGELAHAHLKEEQGIRGTAEEHRAAALDAVGDTIVYLVAYCAARGWDAAEALATCWEQVRQRDWRADKNGGGE